MTAERKGQSTLVIALVFGLAAGLLGGVSELTNASIVGDFGELLMGYIAICGFIALAAGAGLVAARISKRAIAGLWVGLLVGVIAALIANTTRVGVSIAFYDFVRYDLQIPDWVHRDSSTFVNYLIKDRIGGFIYMPPFFGAIGAVCGIIGGLLSKARDMRGVL